MRTAWVPILLCVSGGPAHAGGTLEEMCDCGRKQPYGYHCECGNSKYGVGSNSDRADGCCNLGLGHCDQFCDPGGYLADAGIGLYAERMRTLQALENSGLGEQVRSLSARVRELEVLVSKLTDHLSGPRWDRPVKFYDHVVGVRPGVAEGEAPLMGHTNNEEHERANEYLEWLAGTEERERLEREATTPQRLLPPPRSPPPAPSPPSEESG